MPEITDEKEFIEALHTIGMEMRVGRKLGRTLYLHMPGVDPDQDIFVGTVDLSELADEICRRWNEAL